MKMMMSSIIDWSDKEAVKEYKRKERKQRYKENSEAEREASNRYRKKHRGRIIEYRKNQRQEFPNIQRRTTIKWRYNLSAPDFHEICEKQNGHCANPDCNIKLVDPMFFEEKREYENDLNLTAGVDYSRCNVDHDHDYALKHGKCKEMIRGLLCSSCNRNDVLNPDSKHYIHNPKVSDFTE